MANDTNGISATSSADSSRERNQQQAGRVYSQGRRRAQAVLTPEEIKKINEENNSLGKKNGFSPAAIVDISKNAKKLWEKALAKRGGVMNIARPYFSSRLLDKMKKAGQLGPGGMASLAYKRMVDIFI